MRLMSDEVEVMVDNEFAVCEIAGQHASAGHASSEKAPDESATSKLREVW